MEYIASISYGKDSLAMLEAIKRLNLPLTRIVHSEVWATDTISADLPPMVEFKKKADGIIKERYGIDVEHFCAMTKSKTFQQTPLVGGVSKLTYERYFYHRLEKGKHKGTIKGFPQTTGAWCKQLKYGSYLRKDFLFNAKENAENLRIPDEKRKLVYISQNKSDTERRVGVVQYLGIAEDEPERLARLDGVTKISPLHLIGWTEADCRKWCEENDLLSPIYTTATRGGGAGFATIKA